MKLRHNKKRNTAFVYEILINEISKASMHNLQEKKDKALKILKTFFSKNCLLREELDIYRSFDDLENVDASVLEKIIFEARGHAASLSKEEVYKEQSKLINLINKNLGAESWDGFVRDYKKLATINQAVFTRSNPKKQVFVEQKLVKLVSEKEQKPEAFPTVNKLALKTFLEKFNNQYSETLNENQKSLLNEYVTSYKDNGLQLKVFLYQEIDRLREGIQAHVQENPNTFKNLELVLEKINNYQNRNVDKKLVTEVIKIQSLVGELQNGD
jgi:hypothetical protein